MRLFERREQVCLLHAQVPRRDRAVCERRCHAQSTVMPVSRHSNITIAAA
jgi:hypothetical protein